MALALYTHREKEKPPASRRDTTRVRRHPSRVSASCGTQSRLPRVPSPRLIPTTSSFARMGLRGPEDSRLQFRQMEPTQQLQPLRPAPEGSSRNCHPPRRRASSFLCGTRNSRVRWSPALAGHGPSNHRDALQLPSQLLHLQSCVTLSTTLPVSDLNILNCKTGAELWQDSHNRRRKTSSRCQA